MGAVERLRVPPHSVEAEQALLGGLLFEPTAWTRAKVSAEDFYRADHRLIFSAAADLIGRNREADSVTVIEALSRAGQLEAAGGRAYIAQLVADTPSAANIAAYARIVRENARKRQLHGVGQDIAAGVFESGDVSEQIGNAMQALLKLAEAERGGRGLVGMRELVGALIDDLDRRREGQSGLRLGLPDFDALSNGLEPGDLVVIAGRPGMGKTALLVSIAAHVSALENVAVFSAEMSAQQLMRRALALMSNLSQGKLRQVTQLSEHDWSAIESATSVMAQRRLWVDDKPSPSLTHVRAETLALKARMGLGLVLVDYVQLIQGAGANRYEQLRDVAYGLKGLAKEAGVPVILLAQLNRGVESRDHKRGRLSDLRDSGAIEEAADIVGMLYSEGYYDPDFGMPNVLECQIEKNRNGERGECLWHFAGEYSRVGTLQAGAMEHYRKLRASKRKPKDGDDL
jgi:replicative DNA helicase